MADRNPLYAVMITLAEQDRWLFAREIGSKTGMERREVNSILYTHRDLFVRTDEDKPRWQLSDGYRGKRVAGPPARLAPPPNLAPLAIALKLPAAEVASFPADSPTIKNTCEACQMDFEGDEGFPINLCRRCLEVRAAALREFADYEMRLPTMKDFGLYDSD